jgi:hypothetical protein
MTRTLGTPRQVAVNVNDSTSTVMPPDSSTRNYPPNDPNKKQLRSDHGHSAEFFALLTIHRDTYAH